MKTMARWGMIALAGWLFWAASTTEAQAQWSNVYPARVPQYGNYARTLYPNAGRPSRRTNYAAFRPYVGDACGGFVVAPTYALPGLAPFRPEPTTAYFRNPPGVNNVPSPYGYDYHLNYPAAWYNGYWGW
ncbi:MAG TPA: hypothetical protein VMV10_12445 [Pirellulales bacterium]|nr:hypothetical protein [Pirellulales bacterium]